jgi:hypothetical protein
MFIMLYLRSCFGEPLNAGDREAGPLRSVAGVARLAFLTNPEADYWLGFVPPEVDPRKAWSLEEPGPVSVQASEWPAFQVAFRGALGHGLMSLGAQSYRYGLNESIYPLSAAERLARGLLDRATPFPETEPKVITLHCNSPASMCELRAAEDVVTGGLPPDLERALAGRLLAPKAAAAGRMSQVDEVLRTEQRDLYIYLLKAIGLRNGEVARWLLDNKLIAPRRRTKRGAAMESAVRKVREVWNEFGRTGQRRSDPPESEEAQT